MAKDPAFLRERFFRLINQKWSCANTYDTNYKDLKNKSGVYFISRMSYITGKGEIVYVGSTVHLKTRYKSHNIRSMILSENSDFVPVFYFLEMKIGFYDYEIKLIKKLQPKYNTQHRG